MLQQLEHPVSADVSVNDCFRPVSRFFDRISRPEQLLTALPEAMRVLTDPVETGAVTIALPQDVQSHAYDFPAASSSRAPGASSGGRPTAARSQEAVELLESREAAGDHRRRRRPLLRGLGRARRRSPRRSASRSSRRSPARAPMRERVRLWRSAARASSGNPARGEIAREADLVICVGTRLTDFATGSQSLFQQPGRALRRRSTSTATTRTSWARCRSSPTRARRCAP